MYKYKNRNKKLIEWCPICGNFFEYETNSESDYIDNLASFVCCDNIMIDLDSEIAEHVIRLNKLGYITRFSCSGHSIDGFGYVLFKYNDDVIKNNLYSALDDLKCFYFDMEFDNLCLRFKPVGIDFEKTKSGNIYTKKNFNIYLIELLKEFDILIGRLSDLSSYYTLESCVNGYDPLSFE